MKSLAVILREIEQHSRVIEKLCGCMRDRRSSDRIKHTLNEMLKQRVFQICQGYEDGNDCDTLRYDPALTAASGRTPCDSTGLASQPTMCRLENSISRSDNLRIFYAFIDIYPDSFSSKPKFIQPDMDPADNECYGMQQLSLFNGYYEEKCCLPFHVYDGTDGKLISTFLREGKTPSGREIISVLSRIVKKIRERWSDVMIVFRADTHHSPKSVLKYLEDAGIHYIIGKSSNEALKKIFKRTEEQIQKRYKAVGKAVVMYASSSYTADGWEGRKRRVICRIKADSSGVKRRFIITSFTDTSAKYLYETAYCGRARAELMIKDHKNALMSDRSSCSSASANQFRLHLHSAAYVIMHALRSTLLKGTDLENAQFDTLRYKLLKPAVRVKTMKTKIRCILQDSFKYINVYAKACMLSKYIGTA